MEQNICPMKNIYLLLLITLPFFSKAQIITTIAGTGAWSCSGDGGPATAAAIGQQYGAAVDASGNIYINCSNCRRIKKISPSGIITTVVGTGAGGSTGDGGPATAATFDMAYGLAVDKMGNLYFTDWTMSVIRKVDAAGIISTIAGDPTVLGGGYSGDGGPAIYAQVSWPTGIATDNAGNLFFADEQNNMIRKISTSGIMSRVGGTGLYGSTGDGGPALSAGIQAPAAVAVDNAGNIYVVEDINHRVRKISTSGVITAFAGNGTIGYSGDGGPATAAQLAYPQAITADDHGNIFIAESRNNIIRKVDAAGIISTYAGDGTRGHSGDGGAATAAQLNAPYGIAIDKNGFIYVPELDGAYVRKLDTCMMPFIAPITGDTLLCLGDTVLMADTTTGGVWTISDTGVASIDGSGVVRSKARGMATISYSVANSCATKNVSKPLVVGPYAGTITGMGTRHHSGGTDTFCYMAFVQTNGTPGGVWGLTDTTVAMFDGTGMIRPLTYWVTDTVFYAVTDSCGSDTAYQSIMIVWCPDGVNQAAASNNEINIYPNPANNELHITATNNIAHITITNMVGQMIYNREYDDKELTVNVADLPPGIYLVRVNGSDVRRFVKE